MTESMGGIVDRTQEHLGTTDVAVIAARRRLITMARDLQDGIEPSEALQPEIYNVRAVDMVCPQDDFSGSWTSTPRRPAARLHFLGESLKGVRQMLDSCRVEAVSGSPANAAEYSARPTSIALAFQARHPRQHFK